MVDLEDLSKMLGDGMLVFKGLLRSIVSDKEIFEWMAQAQRQYFDALRLCGFDSEQAMRLLLAITSRLGPK